MTGEQKPPIVFIPSGMSQLGYFDAEGKVTEKGLKAIAHYHMKIHGSNPLNPFSDKRFQ